MMAPHTRGCILFDWGDTLMRVFPEFSGRMKDWPRVEALPGAAETLAALHPVWTLALATNAADSEEADIRLALRHADLDRWLDRVYCYKKIGHKKPAPEFFGYVVEDLGLPPGQIIMVGDDYEADVLGANRSGLRAVWLNLNSGEVMENDLHRTAHNLGEIPGILEAFIEPL